MRYLILFFAFLLYASDLNLSLYQDPKYLQKLLQNIDKNGSKEEVALLEKTLIQKILTFHSTNPSLKISSPKNQQDLANLIDTGFHIAQKVENLTQLQKEITNKIETLKEQIDKSETPQVLALQLAYHQKELQSVEKAIERYQTALQKIKQSIEDSIATIHFQPKAIKNDIAKLQNQIASLRSKIESLKLKKERYVLINDQKSVQYIDSLLQNLSQNLQQSNEALVAKELLLFFYKIKHKKSDAIELKNEILRQVSNEATKEMIANFLDELSKRYLGLLKTIKLSTFEQLKLSFEKFWHSINEPIFEIGGNKISLFKLIVALIIMIVAFIIGSFYKTSINRLDSKSVSSSTKTLLANLGYYTILLIAFFIALHTLHIDLTSIALIAGALSVGIGFGLQNIVSNLVSGLILMFERSIKIGDYIEIDGELRGRVTDIRMRSTTISTNDNIDIVVPNQKFIQDNVINWTMNDKIRRFEIPFGVAYGTDPNKVIQVVLEAVKNSGFKDIYSSKNRFTRVIMTGMGDSSVDFKLFVWIQGEEILYPQRTRSRFLILIYNALYENGIEIPFPQRDLHLRSIDPSIRFNINLKEHHGSHPSSDIGNR